MRTIGMLAAVVVLMSGLTGCAGTESKDGVAGEPKLEAPKPPPEQKNFDVWIGTWNYEGEAKDTPIGPAAKFTGKCIGRAILDGFFFELKWEEKDWQSVDVYWYDAGGKTYRYQELGSDGVAAFGSGTWNGGTWTAAWSSVLQGVEYRFRSQCIVAADGKSVTINVEISADGKTWTPAWEIKMKR
ncbi:MAG: hypothetical protein NTU53_01640 [Planctomycetota bacterium]|nr:hypothetical protein [Planctomycetota bacterium]